MWFIMNIIDSHSIEWEVIMFINIRVPRLHSTDWKSSLIPRALTSTCMQMDSNLPILLEPMSTEVLQTIHVDETEVLLST